MTHNCHSDEELRKRRRRNRNATHSTSRSASYTNQWKIPAHMIIQQVKKKYPSLSWLRVLMSYHRFPNLRELFQGDLNSKVLNYVTSLDFATLECNCRNKNLCPYGGMCRTPLVVYKVTCLTTKKEYIVCTQRFVKKRIQEHVMQAKTTAEKGTKFDSFSNHFAQLILETTKKRKDMNQFVRIKVENILDRQPTLSSEDFWYTQL